jgi:hypothetical protein
MLRQVFAHWQHAARAAGGEFNKGLELARNWPAADDRRYS